MITPAAVWCSDEPCPDCDAGLVLLGHGEPVQTAECRACGYSQTWDFTPQLGGGDQ